ncbi:MAG: AraC family transcriptional regulator [Deltaproteobacteria bacterium]|nr:AraC family transcriptional regulator [Deltaproteobacteria bacterium]
MARLSISYIKVLCDVLSQNGINYQACLKDAGIDKSLLKNINSFVPVEKHIKLIEEANAKLKNPRLGLLMGEATHPGTFHLLGYLCINSANLREAFHSFNRYKNIFSSEAKKLSLETKGDNTRYIYQGISYNPLYDRIRNDFILSSALTIVRLIVNQKNIKAKEVTFTHPPTCYISSYKKFFGCSVRFNHSYNSIAFSSKLFDQSFFHANSDLYKSIEEEVKRVLLEEDENLSLKDRAYYYISKNFLEGFPNMADLSQHLKIAPHGLRRRLKEEGSSYEELIKVCFKKISSKLTLDPKLSNTEIAYMLGYSEPSAFYHAFKRAFGMSPSEYRLKFKV